MKPHWPVPAGLHTASARLPVEGELPSFGGATGWLNSPPLTPAGLRGNVVLAGFWTYTCINWLRQLPYVRAWAGKYAGAGLVVIGVHTPEFPFEHDVDNVRRAVREMRVDYPVALDNDYAIWNAFANHYWPALYFADAHGRIRHHHFGEGQYQQSEMVLQQPHAYAVPAELRLNHWALSGTWTMGEQAATASQAGGQIAYRFHARDLHLVMGPAVPDTPVRFRVLIDGQPPGPAHGTDTDGHGHGTVAGQRLYQLIRQPGPVTDRTFEITFPDPGVQAYVFTFG